MFVHSQFIIRRHTYYIGKTLILITISNFYDSENIDTIIEEVLEDLITAVVSDSSVLQIETTVQSVLQDIVAMEFGYRGQRPSSTGH
ncbi:unnamed protein product [Macrosiphum euphorbiae]|uniref:Uncharacterized protein n=1 Tax=Macrosiphum euphorbiae TaxID=13131 RepID=A0AAV0W039_9HEMI|nr:unnamed protein product [Macrosiphum euphorbiae]